MSLRSFFVLGLFVSLLLAQPPKPAPPKRPVRPGVKESEVKRSMENVKPEASFSIPGVPDWQVVSDDAVWISNGPRNNVARLDPKLNMVTCTIPVGQKPCAGLAVGFGSVWVPNCGDKTVSRIDMKSDKVVATIAVGPAGSEGGITASPDSIWLPSDPRGMVSRIDPATNKVVAEVAVAPGSFAAAWGEGAVWVTSTEKNLLQRIDPATNLVTETIEVGKAPRFLTVGEGAVWTLNQTEGNVTRVDPKTNKVVTTIELGVPGPGGEIAVGEGYIWVTSFDFPITRIDPVTNKVVQQFAGPGGDAIRVGFGSVWLSNLRQQNVWRLDPGRL